MKKFNISMVSMLMLVFVIGGCGKLNKYTPYLGAVKALNKAYEIAESAIKKADTEKELIGIFEALAAAHDKSSPLIIKYMKNFPELRDRKGKDFPESLKEDSKKLSDSMQSFVKTVQTSKNLKPFQNNKKLVKAVEKWTNELQELSKKLNQFKKKK